MTDEALRELQPRFRKLYAKTGRPSIAPEKLLRALLLQALYSVRSERLLMEQLDYNLLFRWAYVAEHIQLLLVLSTHTFFLSGWVVETREFCGTALDSSRVFPQPARRSPLRPETPYWRPRHLRLDSGPSMRVNGVRRVFGLH